MSEEIFLHINLYQLLIIDFRQKISKLSCLNTNK